MRITVTDLVDESLSRPTLEAVGEGLTEEELELAKLLLQVYFINYLLHVQNSVGRFEKVHYLITLNESVQRNKLSFIVFMQLLPLYWQYSFCPVHVYHLSLGCSDSSKCGNMLLCYLETVAMILRDAGRVLRFLLIFLTAKTGWC